MKRRFRTCVPSTPRRVFDPPELLVDIEKPVYGGSFLARDQGKAVFVPLVLPGESARVRVIEEKKGYGTAEVEQVVSASPRRIGPACPHFGACGGCDYQHAGYDAQLEIKQAVLRETLKRGGVAPPEEIAILSGEPWQYRNRIRVAFDAEGNPGYRGRGSHVLVSIRECPISAPLLVRAALVAADVLRPCAQAVRPAEAAFFCNADETSLLLTMFAGSSPKPSLDDIANELRARIPELAGVELVVEGGNDGPPRTIAQWGERELVYRAAGADYRVDHGAFFQVNRWLVDSLVEQVVDGRSGALAWDLFAGVGLFARKLGESFGEVIAVESAPTATESLAANLKGTAAKAVRMSTLQFLRENRRGRRPDLMVVDPPRAGLGGEVTGMIAKTAPPALTYVSCDPATLSRDLRVLVAAGYAMESVTLVDLFPQTFHLETVVRMGLP